MGEPIINQPHAVYGPGKLELGENVFISEHSWFSLPQPNARVLIGNNTQIGRFFGISCIHEISIGQSCLIAERVFITDTGHRFEDPTVPIIISGNTTGRPVVIDDDVWIGVNACILPGVHIGYHAVIGAGSVVTSDVPAYSVAAGNPARVIKAYDHETHSWIDASIQRTP